MKRIKNPVRTFIRQSHAGIADGNGQVTFGIHSRSDRQFPPVSFMASIAFSIRFMRTC